MHARLFAISLTATLGAALVPAQSTPSAALLVLSKKDHTLAIVDPATLKVIARMPSGPDPHEVEAATDGKLAYISNYGGGAYNTITIVDLVARKTLRAFDLGALRGPHGLDYAGGKLYFTAEANKVIGSYDPASDKVDWVMGTGQDRTHMVKVSSDLKRIVTTNVSSGTVSILQKTEGGPGPGRGPGGGPGWEQTIVPVGKGSEGFDVSPDGKEMWVAAAQDGAISVIDLAAKKVDATLQANVRSANRLKFTPDGKLVLVSCLNSPDLTILDASTRKELKRIKLGRGAAGILMQPGGARAFIACTPDDYVAVIDLKTLTVTGKIDAGGGPDGLAWAVRD
jgi:YVTN family beta-propeller protein